MFWAQWIRLALGYLCVLNHPPECLSQVTINTIAMVFWIHNAIICCLSLKPAYAESMNTLLVTVGLFLFCTLNVGTLNLNYHHQKLVWDHLSLVGWHVILQKACIFSKSTQVGKYMKLQGGLLGIWPKVCRENIHKSLNHHQISI